MNIKDKNEYGYQDINLIATYEEMMCTPRAQKVTHYFGDYGSHYFEYGVTDEQIAEAYEKALSAVNMTEDEFHARHDDFIYRGDIISEMWDCQLLKDLPMGEKVWFVPTRPDSDGKVRIQTGTVEGIDTAQRTCKISLGSETMDNVPLHYVLGWQNEAVISPHYGQSHLEPFYYENLMMCDHYKNEVLEKWEQNASVTPEQTM